MAKSTVKASRTTASTARDVRQHVTGLQIRAAALARQLVSAQKTLVQAEAAVRDLANDLADVVDLADDLARIAKAAGASPLPERHRVLDVAGPREQLVLDGEPMVWNHGDGRPRPITRTAECGRLLVDLAYEESLDGWRSAALSRAVQQLRLSPALGRGGVVGRGRGVRLAVPVRLASTLALREVGRRAVKGRAPRDGA